jgi:hypothetical protein
MLGGEQPLSLQTVLGSGKINLLQGYCTVRIVQYLESCCITEHFGATEIPSITLFLGAFSIHVA